MPNKISDKFHAMPEWDGKEKPQQFTYPFAYVADEMCQEAAKRVRRHVESNQDLLADASKGKMFGVLIVENSCGQMGYLASFSGTLGGRLQQPGFVDPVLDYETPDCHFKQEEQQISAINHRIDEMENSEEWAQSKREAEMLSQTAAQEIRQAKERAQRNKKERDKKREEATIDGECDTGIEAELTRQSQHEKAEIRRLKSAWATRIEQTESIAKAFAQQIEDAKTERKTRSEILQRWLFDNMRVTNNQGETESVWDIFDKAQRGVPPSGTGDCAAPKLLQYAYIHKLRPVSMAEFWMGESPTGDIRHDGHFYPACQTKCGPILKHMLKGLPTMPNPLETGATHEVEIVYEDQWLIVVNKPAGVKTASEANNKETMMGRVQSIRPEISGPGYVHRLDMATSGLLMIAKSKEVHKTLQKMFESREVRKKYVAILEGVPQDRQGTIDLPIGPNYTDRPRQMIDHENGKSAVTRYETVASSNGRTRIHLYPHTGRTHQLRVHMAMPEGLACPIVGDNLYGTLGERLMLHAEQIEFVHPFTNKKIRIERSADF